MSQLWKRLFTVKNGATTIGSFALRLANTATKLLFNCDCCPCEPEWYIVALCPCASCDAPVRCANGADALDVDGDPLYFDSGDRVQEVEYADARRDECIPTAVGCGIDAIKHLCREPPFTGTVSAKVYVAGDEIAAAAWSGSCTAGVQQYLGWYDFSGDNKYARLLPVGYQFAEKGVVNIDLVVEFSATGEKTVRYTCRRSFKVWERPETVEAGQVLIVPGWITKDDSEVTFCRYIGTYLGKTVSFSPNILKGPFDTEAHAQAVYDDHQTIIDLYAEKCACAVPCNLVNVAFSNYDVVEGRGWQMTFPGSGSADKIGCEVGWIQYEIDYGAKIEGRIYRPDGSYSAAGTSGVLRPCEMITFWATEEPPEPSGQYSGDFGLTYQNNFVYGASDPCPFCPNTDFDGSPTAHCAYHLETDTEIPPRWLSDWEYTPDKDGGPHGVPNNTAEHLDDIGEVLMAASVYRQMLDDLPEGLA